MLAILRTAKSALRDRLPAPAWDRLRRLRQRWRRLTKVDFGDLRRVTPIYDDFGWRRGQPVDRYYIEQFLAEHADTIRGRVLEAGDDRYTKQFGGAKVTRSDILDVFPGNSSATIIADLSCAEEIAEGLFDCIVLTQVIQMIYDVQAALRHVHRILKPGGVFLMTTHGMSRICRQEGVDNWGEYWRFTAQSLRHHLGQAFPDCQLEVTAHGNTLAAVAFLHGLAAEDLTPQELDYRDPRVELLLAARVVKKGLDAGSGPGSPASN